MQSSRRPVQCRGKVPLLAVLVSLRTSSAAHLPPISTFLGVNAAFTLSEIGNGQGAGESGPFIKFVGGGFSSIDACAAAASAWRNTSSPNDRCLAATYFRAPKNASFLGQCFCLVNPKWFPVPSSETDSARILWPCTSDEDCSFNGGCDVSSGLCTCDAAWGGPRCGELQLSPVDATRTGLHFQDNDGRNVSTCECCPDTGRNRLPQPALIRAQGGHPCSTMKHQACGMHGLVKCCAAAA